jgi:hypothetical protein
MSDDMLEIWAEQKENKRQRHAVAYDDGIKAIEQLCDAGYDIRKCSQWHYKIGTMSLWPSSRRFYDSSTGQKGTYGRELFRFIQKRFQPKGKQ